MTDVTALINRLASAGQTVAAAESLTGGLFLAALTEVPGASQVVRGGMVVYATDAKHLLAGVPTQLLLARGPVDSEVARALAMGARDRLGATYGVGITGVAGPTKQDDHPVGEVHCAVVGPMGQTLVSHDFAALGNRPEIRRAACEAAVALLDAVSRESTS
ncbi:MAG TPA: CinA family protein [Actinomycetes bacterium]|nr:CinA family protein [Actinomycetes bacterium]